jgi:hypothetical protein
MISIQIVVDAISTTRSEFAEIFFRAQQDFAPEDRVAFEAVAQMIKDKDAFGQALGYSQARGFFDILLDMIINNGHEDGSLKRLRSQENIQVNEQAAPLQAMINQAMGFAQPDVMAKGFDNGIRWTGKVFIDNTFKGTGVLIAPHLMLTAWHVVKDMFTISNSQWSPDPINGNRILIEFDDYYLAGTNNRTTANPVRISARQENWCVLFSTCRKEELQDQLPTPPTLLDGFWDYAVIRLSGAVGWERTWAKLNARAIVPQPDEEIILFQYPAGQPMRVARHTISSDPPPDQQVIPRLRFLHGANALNGSSGGPCFDKNFSLFGLHQGQWIWQAATNKKTNRGIPIIRILEDIDRRGPLPPPDPSDIRIWSLGKSMNFQPVIGTDQFQSIVWDAALNGRFKIIDIKGAPGFGKTFLLSLLGVLLPEAGYLQIKLSTEVIGKLNALQLAREICKEARAEIPNFISQEEMSATSVNWVKDELVTKVINSLDAVRNGKQVWLCIAELNKFDIVGELASEFLYAMYEKAIQLDWLRIVLDGLKGSIPTQMSRASASYRINYISTDGIKSFFRLFFANLQFPVGAQTVAALSIECQRKYEKWLAQNEASAMKLLAMEVSDKMDSYLI